MSIEGVPDSERTIAKSSLSFLSGTFLSRLSGLGRDTVLAAAFGAQPAIAAFMVAFRFANLMRRLFGEGPLSAGFIPHFEQLRNTSPKSGAYFFRDLFFSLILFLAALIAGVELVLLWIWGQGALSPANSQILFLTILMLPGVLFICLFGLCSGLLQANRRFFLTGFAPFAFNAVWMAAALVLRGQEAELAVVPLSLAVAFAFLMQWAMVAPAAFSFLRRSLSWKECLQPQLFSSSLRAVVKPFSLGVLGVAAVQINSALDAVFARYASLEGPAYLWYAIRIEQLPLALFGIALSSALLPPLARAIKTGEMGNYTMLLRFALRRSFSLIFPCSAGIFVLGGVGINLLYGHGDFTSEATYQTLLCLWGYGFGLLPAVFVLLLAPAFYAMEEYRIPTLGTIISVGTNLLLTSLLVFGLKWGAFSIAVATSVCAWVNYFYLSHYLSKKIGESAFTKPLLFSFLKTAFCSIAASVAALLAGHFLVGDVTLGIWLGRGVGAFQREFGIQCLQFLGMGGVFALILFSYAWMLNAEDILEWIPLSKSRKN